MENLQDIKGDGGTKEEGVYKRKSIETRRYVGTKTNGEGKGVQNAGCEKKKNGKE